MIIRTETTADYAAISQIHLAAFADHPYSRQTEHLIVEGLRADNALTVSLVAERDRTVVGHIAFSLAQIGGVAGRWHILGPIGVLPAVQRQGIGKALVESGLATIKTLGAQGCVLVGDPAYYERFGFRNEPALEMEGVPPRNLLCYPFVDAVPPGRVTHHPAFMAGL